MFLPPAAVAPAWDTCAVMVDASALSDLDRRLMRKAKKRVGRLTGIRFVRSNQNPIPGIRVWYTYTDNFSIAQTALQSDSKHRITWAGIHYVTISWPAAVGAWPTSLPGT